MDSPILMTGGSDMAVVIEMTIMATNSAIVSNVKSVHTWATMTSFLLVLRKARCDEEKKRKS